MLSPQRIQCAVLVAFALCCSVLSASMAPAQDKAAGSTPSGKVSICQEIDDDWKCVGQSSEWEADKPFNVLFENKGPVGVDFIGIVFYKQGADGKDVEH